MSVSLLSQELNTGRPKAIETCLVTLGDPHSAWNRNRLFELRSRTSYSLHFELEGKLGLGLEAISRFRMVGDR